MCRCPTPRTWKNSRCRPSPRSSRRPRPSATGEVMSKKPYDSLSIPPAARNENGVEVMRAAVVGQSFALSLRRSFDDPAAWGLLFATAARQMAHVYASELGGDEAMLLARLREAVDTDLDAAGDAGTVTAAR